MIELHAEDWFYIKGRGKVACIEWPAGLKRDELADSEVKIDGELYKVWGMEAFRSLYTCAPFSEDDLAGQRVGLLVKPVEGIEDGV